MSPTALSRHRQLGLTDDEAARIPELLGREPSDPELVMFSLMWSEHCSYKHSKPLLGAFPTTGDRVLQGPGENAGVVDVGDGLAVALKIESHNHPSAVEPFEGAATGVGGIVRDILAMGARPIALLDSLRFGELTSPRSRHLFTRSVAGIGHYGNCIGVPTVGGEVSFDDRYEESCLVNAMCVGVVDPDRVLKAAASGPGNALVLIGNRTGRDGIGGASVLASAELDEDEDKRPSVQVSDPFTERKLMDCCLELAEAGAFVALQDLGAAGLTSAASEMAAKGRLGLDIDLDLVPLRERLSAAEILVSESQERMLAVVEPGRVDEVVAACRRWDLDATPIGAVTEGENLVARSGGEVVVDLPARLLADEAPVYGVPRVPAPAARAARPRDVPGAGRPRRRVARAALPPGPRQQAVDLRALRPPGRGQHDPPARRRRRGGAPAGVGAGDRAHHRLRRAPLRARPARRGPGLGAGGRPEPGVRGSPAGGRDRLPQLPQPGEGLHGLAAGGGDRGDERRAPGAGGARRVRERVPLQ